MNIHCDMQILQYAQMKTKELMGCEPLGPKKTIDVIEHNNSKTVFHRPSYCNVPVFGMSFPC